MAGYDDEDDELDEESSKDRWDSFAASLVDDSDATGCTDKRPALSDRKSDDEEDDDEK